LREYDSVRAPLGLLLAAPGQIPALETVSTADNTSRD